MMKRLFYIGVLTCLLAGCTGSGAVNPLTPKKASQDSSGAVSDINETVYWSLFPANPPVTATLQGLCMVSSNLGFACGSEGTVLQYDGTVWKKIDTGVGGLGDLYACTFLNDSEGWMVGGHGVILSYHDGKWSQDNSGTQETLYDVVITKARRGWAVGTNGTLLSYNGTSWDKVTISTTADLCGIGLNGTNGGWVVGDRGTLLKFDGSVWTVSADSPVSDKIQKVFTLSDVEAWGVGAYGNFIRYNGTAWSRVSGTTAQDINDVWMNDSQDGWAVGQDGLMLHYDGSRWNQQTPVKGKPAINAVAFVKKLGFAVGQSGTILKYQPGGIRSSANIKFDATSSVTKDADPPVWKVVLSLVNDGGKPLPKAELQLALPKGYFPVTETVSLAPKGKPVSAATPNVSGTPTVVSSSPTPSPTLIAMPKPPDASGPPGGSGPPSGPPGSSGPGSGSAGRTNWTSSSASDWKWSKGVVSWTIGNFEPAATKSVTLSVSRGALPKNGKVLPPVLKMTCLSDGNECAEGGPFSLVETAALKTAKTPSAPTTASPSQGSTPSPTPNSGAPISSPTEVHADPKAQPQKP
jgi:photosystem II stability/assembly factor-like uncharacterized protein